ncbi:MFS transporter [Parabacteroides sp. PF5-6]|uniref:MFS transporter n=1 Tax=Parabacteroides sp. PF5-6 TaxID=1742403 RepID=UPI002407693B|nr:MFS transporter [Parabacteroides sp. PF5-6]MDF9830736.1 FSR family fosmidomycin resistance protein-like MFS transporter [Parabacteroides sp. PF5-6]
MNKTSFRVLIALSMVHLINDALQSVISASYPLIKEELLISFTQIGIITLAYQLAASVFQPVVGWFFDKYPVSRALPIGMSFTLVGLVSLSQVTSFYGILISVFLVGIGSSVTHPEASRITSLASGGRRGLAQSIFQVGGNFGGALGPLLVAFLVAPYGRQNIAWFSIFAFVAILIMIPITQWYKRYLTRIKRERAEAKTAVVMPLPLRQTVFAIGVLLLLIFSKYVYTASLSSYYTFYLIEKFDVTISHSQVLLFVYLVATAIGTLLGGPLGDRIGRKYVIWLSILGAAPFTLILPYVGLTWTVVLTFCIGLIISSAFPAILVYAQELLPYKLGLVSGLFFGFAFGIGGIASAILGRLADVYGIEAVYHLCAYMPLLGLVTWFLPNLKKKV